MLKTAFLTIILSLFAAMSWAQDAITQQLQDISVTIKTDRGQGSAVLITRKVGEDTVSWALTAAHVVSSLRQTREVIDGTSGNRKTIVEFKDANIVQEFRENGRRIGEAVFDAQVVRYSDSENGEDLALLRIRKKNFVQETVTAKFYLDDVIPAAGTELWHVGSLMGQVGSNSLTDGVISQIGRVLDLGANGVTFDQCAVLAMPGSSGGGVFLKSDGRYVGMLVRGSGEAFNLIVPVRRMRSWATKVGVLWVMDPNIAVPTEDEVMKLPVDDIGVEFKSKEESPPVKIEFPFLIKPLEDQSEDRPVFQTISLKN